MMARLAWLPFALLLIVLPFPGTVAARLLLLLIVAAIALGWRLRPGTWAALPCKPALMAWWLIGAASLGYAVDPVYSLGELKNEFGYTLLALCSFFVLGQRPRETLLSLRGLALGMAILSGWAFGTWASNGFQWFEYARHGGQGVVATYVVTALPALIWLSVEDPSVLWRRIARLLFVAALLLAAITTQRAAWPAIGVELALLVALLARNGRLTLSRRVVMAGLLLALATLGLAAILIAQRPGGFDAPLRDTRLAFWPQVLATIAANPLAGGGFGIQAMSKAYPHLVPEYNRQLLHAHNVFLNYGLALGLPGIAALLALFVAWGRFFWHRRGEIAGIAGCVLVAGVVVRNQFNDFFMRDMSLLFWALCGLFAGICLRREEQL